MATAVNDRRTIAGENDDTIKSQKHANISAPGEDALSSPPRVTTYSGLPNDQPKPSSSSMWCEVGHRRGDSLGGNGESKTIANDRKDVALSVAAGASAGTEVGAARTRKKWGFDRHVNASPLVDKFDNSGDKSEVTQEYQRDCQRRYDTNRRRRWSGEGKETRNDEKTGKGSDDPSQQSHDLDLILGVPPQQQQKQHRQLAPEEGCDGGSGIDGGSVGDNGSDDEVYCGSFETPSDDDDANTAEIKNGVGGGNSAEHRSSAAAPAPQTKLADDTVRHRSLGGVVDGPPNTKVQSKSGIHRRSSSSDTAGSGDCTTGGGGGGSPESDRDDGLGGGRGGMRGRRIIETEGAVENMRRRLSAMGFLEAGSGASVGGGEGGSITGTTAQAGGGVVSSRNEASRARSIGRQARRESAAAVAGTVTVVTASASLAVSSATKAGASAVAVAQIGATGVGAIKDDENGYPIDAAADGDHSIVHSSVDSASGDAVVKHPAWYRGERNKGALAPAGELLGPIVGSSPCGKPRQPSRETVTNTTAVGPSGEGGGSDKGDGGMSVADKSGRSSNLGKSGPRRRHGDGRHSTTPLPRPDEEYETALLRLSAAAAHAADLYRELTETADATGSLDAAASFELSGDATPTTGTLMEGDDHAEGMDRGPNNGQNADAGERREAPGDGNGIDDGEWEGGERTGPLLESFRESFAAVNGVLSAIASGGGGRLGGMNMPHSIGSITGRHVFEPRRTSLTSAAAAGTDSAARSTRQSVLRAREGTNGGDVRARVLGDGHASWSLGEQSMQAALGLSAREGDWVKGLGGVRGGREGGRAAAVEPDERDDVVPPEVSGMLHRYSEMMLKAMQVSFSCMGQ